MSSNLDQIFETLNSCYFLGNQTLIFNIYFNEIKNAANNYFKPGQSHAEHDQFFNRFTPIWMDLITKRRFFEATKIWMIALRIVTLWEQNNSPHKIHKGTPYYFLGVTAILNNELENGFLLMHQSLEEDIRSLGSERPSTPSYFFVTLDYSKYKQFFGLKVKEISEYLSKRLKNYKRNRKGVLTLSQFKTKFLECTDLMEEVFLFVFLLFRLKKLLFSTGNELKKNVFSSLIHAKILFDICLVIEKTIENKNLKARKKGAILLFSDELKYLAKKGSLSINKSRLTQLRNDFNNDFEKTIKGILSGKHLMKLSRIEKDLAIAYGIRNFAAHKLEDQPVLYDKMDKLVQRLLNALFFVIETLY